MARKTIYYRDPLDDDFAGTKINTKTVPADFPFVVRNPFWVVLEFICYRLIATPLVWLIGKIGFGLKIRNRKALKRLRKTGFYLYGNHTQAMMDAYVPTLCVFPHKAHIIANPDAVSIPGIRWLVMMLGAIPLPGTAKGYRAFGEALDARVAQRHVIAVYPEAHIWPWAACIRPFPDGSFGYPVRQNVPAVASVTTYRKRKLFSKLPPKMTVTLSEPFYPDQTLSPREARHVLRDQVYRFMEEHADDPSNYAYYIYLPAEGLANTAESASAGG